jgi:hypothetical protein
VPRTCTACRHPDRKEIDEALVRQVPARELAERYPGLTRRMLYWHFKTHVIPMMALATQADEVANADAILTEVQRLKKRMWNVLDRSEKDKEFSLTVQAAREIRGCIELLAKVGGQIQESTVINIINQTGVDDHTNRPDAGP